MKYILIVGTKDAGKSTTIDSVCKALKPTSTETLRYPEGDRFEKAANTVPILNWTHIIEVDGIIILVVAGTPTEQKITITVLIEICLKIKVKIDFAIVSLRTSERKEGFDTRNELAKFGECILEERIWKIGGEDFKETTEWQKRIEKILSVIYLNKPS